MSALPTNKVSGGVTLTRRTPRRGADRATFVDAVAVREAAAGRMTWAQLRPRERMVVVWRLHERGWCDPRREGWGPERITAWLAAPHQRSVERALARVSGHERRLAQRDPV